MKLKFGDNLIEPEVRWLEELRDVACDAAWMTHAPRVVAYYMYRDLSLTPEHRDIVAQYHLRYDVTVIPPLKMGREHVKTLGHYHPPVAADSQYTYPELYEVLKGEADYLLQRPETGRADRIEDVVLVRAKKGDKVVVPPNYGHVTINSSEKALTMANWVCRSFTSIYEPYQTLHGGAYYELVSGKFLANHFYVKNPEITFKNPKEVPELGLVQEVSMYDLVETPHQLEFLVAPHKYGWVFQDIV